VRLQSPRHRRPSIAVYAIMRDEEAHVQRWGQSAADADALVVADTGSRDGTISAARALGAAVYRVHVQPFRYDVARNQALDRLPSDIDLCVSLDADEVLMPGWRTALEDAWRQGATKVRCTLEWRWSDQHAPLRYTAARAHRRHGYRWECPVHEQLVAAGHDVEMEAPIEIHHLRDPSRPVGGNLDLLRVGVAERPFDSRMVHMLANEARMNGLTEEATDCFHRALALPLGPNERLHSLLMLAHLEPDRREAWTLQACGEFPTRREPWYALAQLQLDHRQWRAARAAAHRALAITEPADDYLANPMAWGPSLDQIAARASRELGDLEWGAHHARMSLAAVDSLHHPPDPHQRDSPLIDFVTVVFNDTSAARRIEEQLRRYVDVPFTFTAIDNSAANRGWAAACNDGASQGAAQLIAFIDQDVEMRDGWLEPVLAAIEADPQLVIAGPRCLDGLPWPRVPVGLTNWVCGACMLVRRAFFVSVGGFDCARFRHEYAETDLERTAETLGYRVQTIEDATVVHRREDSKSEQVLSWRAQGARNQTLKWGVPLDPRGVAHENTPASQGETERHGTQMSSSSSALTAKASAWS
jgi:glycosyltransferase involved in cell wall biosynthesis